MHLVSGSDAARPRPLSSRRGLAPPGRLRPGGPACTRAGDGNLGRGRQSCLNAACRRRTGRRCPRCRLWAPRSSAWPCCPAWCPARTAARSHRQRCPALRRSPRSPPAWRRRGRAWRPAPPGRQPCCPAAPRRAGPAGGYRRPPAGSWTPVARMASGHTRACTRGSGCSRPRPGAARRPRGRRAPCAPLPSAASPAPCVCSLPWQRLRLFRPPRGRPAAAWHP
mmetsp:Transcript_12831/g.43445  ORF Transcript_12831/g.43445 Transcript_12831/m.43445 type:complete len:223 (-) Transcript_12831:1988-2656(-)